MKCWLIENGGAYNRGCEAIAVTTATVVRNKFPGIKIIYWSHHYDLDSTFYNKNLFTIMNPHSRLKPFRFFLALFCRRFFRRSACWLFRRLWCKPDFVISLGGDNYTLDYGKQDYIAARFFIQARVPIYLWSASVGPFSSDVAFEKNMAALLSRFNGISVRESVSREYLRSLGLRGNIYKCWDIAFLLKEKNYEGVSLDFIKRAKGRLVGFNMSALACLCKGADVEEKQLECVQFIEAIVKENWCVILIPHVSASNRRIEENDVAFLKQLYDMLDTEYWDSVCLLEEAVKACETKWIISCCTVFIGARTHSTIAALSTGVPTISVGYSIKAEGINRDVYGSLEYLIPVQEITGALLLSKTKHMMNNIKKIRELLLLKKSEMVDGALRSSEML